MGEALEVFREIDTQLEIDAGDGRTIYGCAVPYDTPTVVADRDGGIPYTETWKRGAFRSVVRDPSRTQLVYGHSPAFGDVLGSTVELRESDVGLEAVFRALPGPDGDKALEMIRAGMLRALSVHAIIPRSGTRHRRDGIVERIAVSRLPHVALVPQGAYVGAGVTAVRASTGIVPAAIADVRARNDALRLRFPATTTVPPNLEHGPAD